MKNLTTKVMTILILFMANSCWLDWGNGNDPSSQKDAEDSIILAWVPCDNVSGIYTIDTAYITEDQLTAELTTFALCGEPDFSLLTCGGYMESYPVQVDVFLEIREGTNCDDGAPFLFQTDLSALANDYRKSYQVEEDSIWLNLAGYDKQVLYRFLLYTQK
jgi:hypothetical protein